jgi:transposase InsO family protein
MIKLTRRQTEAMREANTRSHWLALSAEVRSCLDSIPVNKWSSVVAEAESNLSLSVARLCRERRACLLARTRVNEVRQDGKAEFGSLVKGFIAGCANSVGVLPVTQYFGVHASQISSWKRDERLINATVFLRRYSIHDSSENKEVKPDAAAVPTVPKESLTNMTGQETPFAKLEEAFKRFVGKTRRRYSRSEKREIVALADEFGSKEVHGRLGVSYDTIARLLRRAGRKPPEEVGEVPARYAVILEVMKKHPGMGPMQIRDWIARHHGQRMGVNTVREVMERAGWVPPLVRKKEFRPGQFRRYEAVRRNVLWHADFLHAYINSCKVFVLFLQDDHSRFIVGHGIFDGEKADAVLQVVQDAIAQHGCPGSLMADRGSAFRSWRGIGQLTRFLEEIGVDQHVAIEARVNGKLENLNQQVQKELLDVRRFSSLAEFESALLEWVAHYNFRRCHQGLAKLEVPADRFFPGAMEGYGKSANKQRGEGEMLRLLQEIILATRSEFAVS